tara:strand:- start:902 stop:1930 length:1029 start_codon:yes stop_codon:yes gene_type:complete
MKIYCVAGALAAAIFFPGGALPAEEQFNLEPASLTQLEKAVRSRGDPARGREIFLDTSDAQCANCHRLQGVGGHAGPALDSILGELDIRQLAEALVAPSRKITEGYDTYTIATTDGKILSGLKLKDSDKEVLLRDGLGKDTVIQKKQIARIEKSPVSLMPARLVSRLSRKDLVDLISFLKNPAAQLKLKGRLSRAWITGPFSRSVSRTEPFEKNPDPAKLAVSSSGKLLQWKLINARADGLIQLAGPAAVKKSSAYILALMQSDRDREAVLWLDHSSALRLLVNSETVYSSRDPAANSRLSIRLRKGWNTILSRVSNPTGNSTLGLRYEPARGLRLTADRQE